jgi:hypothetical protein
LVAISVPAPALFSTINDGLAGICFPMRRAIVRAQILTLPLALPGWADYGENNCHVNDFNQAAKCKLTLT